MIAKDKIGNEDLLNASIKYIENHGFENIQADVDGYETPKSYQKKGSDFRITPDIVAEKAGRKHYFEISLKSAEPNELKSKWRFLEVLTRMRDDRFKIITYKGHYKFTQDMLNDINLTKDLIKL